MSARHRQVILKEYMNELATLNKFCQTSVSNSKRIHG